MKNQVIVFAFLLAVSLSFTSCGEQKDPIVLQRDFYENMWERFDYVTNQIEVDDISTFNLVLTMRFDEHYDFNYILLNFTIFNSDGDPYRTKDYKFNLKDNAGDWKSVLKDGYYQYEFSINKDLVLHEPGSYTFRIENRMPKTPLIGVHSLRLYNEQ